MGKETQSMDAVKSNKKQSPINYRRIFVICGIVFALVFLFLIRNVLQSSVLETTVIKYQIEHTKHIKPQSFFNDNKTAFVFGATGIYTTTELFKCTSAIESLVKIGGWAGDIYLLIDDNTCLDPKLMASIPNPNIHIIPFKSERRRRRLQEQRQRQRWLSDVPHHNGTEEQLRRRLFNSQPFERSMAIKTHILDYLKPKIEHAIWYDCDVIFAIPGCVKKMVQTPVEITKKQPFAIPEKYHVGSFIVKQNVSNDALVQWREKILNGNGKSSLGDMAAFPDYKAFKQLFGKMDNDSTTEEKCFVSPHIYHDVVISPMIINSSFADQTQCVIHLTNGRCRHISPPRIQALIDGFHLESLKGKKWCPSLVRRKFKAYGWNWPFCWSPSFM